MALEKRQQARVSTRMHLIDPHLKSDDIMGVLTRFNIGRNLRLCQVIQYTGEYYFSIARYCYIIHKHLNFTSIALIY